MCGSRRRNVLWGENSTAALMMLGVVGLAALGACHDAEGPNGAPDRVTGGVANRGGESQSGRADPSEPRAAMEPETDALPVSTFRLPDNLYNRWRIESVEANGEVRLRDERSHGEWIEGYFLGIAFGEDLPPFPTDACLVRIRISHVSDDKTAIGHVGAQAAEQLVSRKEICLVRPMQTSTVRLKRVPDFAPLKLSDDPSAGHRKRSGDNLKRIGLAMYDFLKDHGHFPPAVMRGPDDTPWHSWRVLLLPYVGQIELYEQYRFDEPWDGPNNKKLLVRIPPVYQDPVHGATTEPYTHYAAITGPAGRDVPASTQTVFPASGVRLRDITHPLESLPGSNVADGTSSPTDITDGTSNTILVGTIDPQRGIPWTKPEDVVFHEAFPPPGGKDGFAAPHKIRSQQAGVFLFADGQVWSLATDVDAEQFRRAMTRAGGKGVHLPAFTRPGVRGRIVRVLEIDHTGDGPVAWFRHEWIKEETRRPVHPAHWFTSER